MTSQIRLVLLSTRFDVSVVGVRRRVRTTQGFGRAGSRRRDRRATPDVVLIPALGAKNAGAVARMRSSGVM